MENAETEFETPVENAVVKESPGTATPEPASPAPKKKAPKPKKPKAPARRRIALCNDCSNEWVASNGNEKKPSRCPVCFGRHVVWRDEAIKEIEAEKEAEVENEKVEKVETMTKSKKEKEEEEFDYDRFFDDEDYGNDDDFTYEDAKAAVPKIPMQAIIFIVGGIALFAGIMFLVGKGKKRISQPVQETQIETTEQKPPTYTYLPPLGGGF